MKKKVIKAIIANKNRSEIDTLKKILFTVYLMDLPLKDYINFETKIAKGKKILWVEIKSSIYTFLAAESTFCKINGFASKSGADIDRILITTPDETGEKRKSPVCFSWAVNKCDRRRKNIHERHYTSFCKYLWWNIFIPRFRGKLSKKQKSTLNRVHYDQSLQDKFIVGALDKLKQENYFVEAIDSVDSVHSKITEEWERRYKGKWLRNNILYRWKALEIGTELGLLKSDRKRNFHINPSLGRISVEMFIEIMEEVERMVEGSIVSKTRKKDIVMRRHFLMYIIRKTTSYSLAEIGIQLGNRHHTTIMNGIKRVEERMETSPVQKAVLEQFCILFDNIGIYRAYMDPNKKNN